MKTERFNPWVYSETTNDYRCTWKDSRYCIIIYQSKWYVNTYAYSVSDVQTDFLKTRKDITAVEDAVEEAVQHIILREQQNDSILRAFAAIERGDYTIEIDTH